MISLHLKKKKKPLNAELRMYSKETTMEAENLVSQKSIAAVLERGDGGLDKDNGEV